MKKQSVVWFVSFVTVAFCLGAQLSFAAGGENPSDTGKNGVGKTSKVSSSEKEQGKSKDTEYRGRVVLVYLDKDFTIFGASGITFKVLRWRESSSPFLDITLSDFPESIDIPMRDWEFGVPSEIPQYDRVPLKLLVGGYVDGRMIFKNPGNSYYDIPIKLSNGKEINPRHYYADPVVTYENFRTNKAAGKYPLVEAVKTMIKTKDYGPLFKIFGLAARPDFPVFLNIITATGHSKEEWDMAMDLMIEAGLLAPGSKIDRIYSLNNPALNWNDPTSTSNIGRREDDLVKDKLNILSDGIDNILSRRIDRENGENPLPNVLIFGDDNPEILKAAFELFDTKVRGVLDHDIKMRVGLPPIRLILVNVADDQYLAPTPSALTSNPQALSNASMTQSRITIFDSNFRYKPGAAAFERVNAKDIEITAVAQAFGVSEAEAKRALSGDVNCDALLRLKTRKGSGK